MPGAQVIGNVNPQQQLDHVSIYFRRGSAAQPLPDVVELSSVAPALRNYLSDLDVAAILEPDANAVTDFKGYLAGHGITIKPAGCPRPGHVVHAVRDRRSV